ncbi:MAG: (Fe-S)-binding protein [Thermodesulfobacteriota bacterium]
MSVVESCALPGEVARKMEGHGLFACTDCGACAEACPLTGAPGLDGTTAQGIVRLLLAGDLERARNALFPWACTGCGLCARACPERVDLPGVLLRLRGLADRSLVPPLLAQGVERIIRSGNTLDILLEDYLQVLADLGGELAREGCPGFYVPVDKPGADIVFFPNSKEIFADFDDLKWWWKIFYAAGESWTVPSTNWDSVDWALFVGDFKTSRLLARRKLDALRTLSARGFILPDCGASFLACRKGLAEAEAAGPLVGPGETFDMFAFYDYLISRIRDGRLAFDRSAHAGRTFVWHDPCEHGRELERQCGRGLFEEPRWILDQVVEKRVEFAPSRSGNYCCGAGGGNWPTPHEKISAFHGRRKAEQIKACGADVVVVGCPNCRDQIRYRLPRRHPGCSWEVKYLWQVVAEALVIPPRPASEIARLEAEGRFQWERLGVMH